MQRAPQDFHSLAGDAGNRRSRPDVSVSVGRSWDFGGTPLNLFPAVSLCIPDSGVPQDWGQPPKLHHSLLAPTPNPEPRYLARCSPSAMARASPLRSPPRSPEPPPRTGRAPRPSHAPCLPIGRAGTCPRPDWAARLSLTRRGRAQRLGLGVPRAGRTRGTPYGRAPHGQRFLGASAAQPRAPSPGTGLLRPGSQPSPPPGPPNRQPAPLTPTPCSARRRLPVSQLGCFFIFYFF